jgi:hypothetical protein
LHPASVSGGALVVVSSIATRWVDL